MNSRYTALGLWSLSTALAIFFRPVTPIDETRYLAVAWEMWLSGEWWVPTLNGVTYADKPPLLFWLINVGWWMFGVNDWWPRLLTSLFGLGVMYLTWHCATQTVKAADATRVADAAVLILIALPAYVLFNGAVMFDLPLTFYSLAAITVILGLKGIGGVAEWCLIGLYLGLAVLTKGPVAYLHVIPLLLLAPLWKGVLEPLRQHSWSRWLCRIGMASLVSMAVVASWLVPAVFKDGVGFLQTLFWDQTIDRIATTAHHLRPGWFYLAVLPVLLLPWIVLPRVWKGLHKAEYRALHRIFLAWVVPVIAALSMFRGKQVHYVFPLLPIFAVLTATAVIVEGVVPRIVKNIAVSVGLTSLLGVYIAIGVRYADAYDVEPMATTLSTLQHQGVVVANVGRYHGQYQFYGRLRQPLAVIRDETTWKAFVRDNPRGYVVSYSRHIPSATMTPLQAEKFRSEYALLWAVSQVKGLSFSEIAFGDFRALSNRKVP